jgi:hypothetical protein
MSASVVINPDRFVADLAARQPNRELSPAGYRRKLKAAGLLPTKEMVAKAVRAPKPRRAQFRIDFERWERYLSYRNLFEFLARAATTPIGSQIQPELTASQRRNTLYDRLCALDHIAQESLVA